MEPGWLAFRTVCWQKMRLKMRRLWSELVDGAVLGLEWILAILDLCLQIPSVAYMLFYQVLSTGTGSCLVMHITVPTIVKS